MARVLICDDSDFMRNTIKGIFVSGGHEIVGEAKDGKEVVEKFEQLNPDLVTMDMLMNIDGIEAIKEIIEIKSTAKIIIISILEEHQGEIVEAIQLGALGYVGKPINKQSLLNEVKRVLEA